MTPTQWQLVLCLFDEAGSRPADQRREWAVREATGDPPVLEALLALLDADANAPACFDEPAGALGLEPAPPTSPTTIGKYTVRGVVGSGRSGIVYHARQDHPPLDVAIKVLRSGVWSAVELRRFEVEVRALSRLSSPGIARILDAGSIPEPAGVRRPYLVMELVRGEPISTFADERDLPLDDRLQLMLQVCDAVEHAHQRGVLHRDLKPDNVLVSSDDGTPRIRVVDFGIARLLDSDADPRVTLTGHALGTPGYMSPEQAGGDPRAVDVRADVYGLGAILHRLLLGSAPTHEPNPLHSRCPRDLRAILGMALQAEPDRRYQSVGELRDELLRVRSHRPVRARPPSVMDAAAKLAQRRPGVVGTGIIAVLALASVFAQREATRRDILQARRRAHAAAAVLLEQTAKIAERVGAGPLRRESLERMLGQIRPFARDYPDDLTIQRGYASILIALGDVEAEHGRFAEALASFQSVVEIRRRLASLGPRSQADAHDALVLEAELSTSLVRRGDARRALGDLAAAQCDYRDALALDRDLATRAPDQPLAISNLAFSCERLAQAAMAVGDHANAESLVREQLALNQRLSDLVPGERRAPLLWADACARGTLALLLDRTSRHTEAQAARELALHGIEQLLVHDPTHRTYLMRLAGLLVSLCERECPTGCTELCRSRLARARSVAHALAEADPVDRECRVVLHHALESSARALLTSDTPTAVASAERAVGLAEELAEEAPHDAASQERLVGSLETLARTRGQMGRDTAAGRAEPTNQHTPNARQPR